MYQVDLYNKGLDVGTDYSNVIDLGIYHLPAWQFALYYLFAGTVGATLTLTTQYSWDKSSWVDGAALVTTAAIGGAMLAVDEATINKLYPMRYIRLKIVVATQNTSSIFITLGMA